MTAECHRAELSEYLRAYLEVALFQDYCPNGLQVEGRNEIRTLATAVTACEETIRSAVDADVDALLVHHGLFWQGESPAVVGPLYRKLSALIQAGINLYAYHLPLDAHREVGNNWRAASDLGLFDLRPCFSFNGVAIGVMGEIEPIDSIQFTAHLEAYYRHSAHYAPGGERPIRRVALLSGGGHKLLAEAAELGCDALVTGSFDEPLWYRAREEGVHFYALGHSATEVVGPKALGEHLAEKYDLKVNFIDTYNPF